MEPLASSKFDHSHEPASLGKQKTEGLPDKAEIFGQLKRTELRRKIGRGIQIGATAVAVVAAAAGAAVLIGGLAATPVGWGLLGAAAVGVGVTAIAAVVSKSRGGSFWNEVLKPQLKGLAVGVTSIVAAIVIGAVALAGGELGSSGGGGGFGLAANSVMLGAALGYYAGGGSIGSLAGPSVREESANTQLGRLSQAPDFDDSKIKEAAHGAVIAQEHKSYNRDDEVLYKEAVSFFAKGAKPNLERAARRLEVLVERNPNDNIRKLELAEVCMMMGRADRAAMLYEELRTDNPEFVYIAAKEVKALRKAGQYDAAITLGNAYKAQAESEEQTYKVIDNQRYELSCVRSNIDMQVKRAEDQKASSR